MENRFLKFVNNWNTEKAEVKYNSYHNLMIKSENGGHYLFALKENNLAYEAAFSLYSKKISKELQLQRLEELMKNAEFYLRQLNLDGKIK